MAYTSVNLRNNSSVKILDVHRRRDASRYHGTAFISGTFGGGTINLQVSPDDGVTKFNVPGQTDPAIIANGVVNFTLAGNGTTNNQMMSLYATLSGATTPNLTVSIYDNK